MTQVDEDMGYDEHEYNAQNPKITFRVTKEEKVAMAREAELAGKSVADMIREKLVTRSSPGNGNSSPGTGSSSPGKGDGGEVIDLKAALKELWRFFNIVADNPLSFDVELDKIDTTIIDKGVKRCE